MAEVQGEWLTVEQVADSLQVGTETVRRWIRARELPALDLGARKAGYRIRPAALETFVAARYSKLMRPWWMRTFTCAGCATESGEPAALIWPAAGRSSAFYALCLDCQSDATARRRVAAAMLSEQPGHVALLDRSDRAYPGTAEAIADRLAVGGEYALVGRSGAASPPSTRTAAAEDR